MNRFFYKADGALTRTMYSTHKVVSDRCELSMRVMSESFCELLPCQHQSEVQNDGPFATNYRTAAVCTKVAAA